jgi:hypothetical protein
VWLISFEIFRQLISVLFVCDDDDDDDDDADRLWKKLAPSRVWLCDGDDARIRDGC